ncbi:hypothetical protein HDU96_008789 [Phlyctochytrium bullatum]|nr:hypothetical protein HDU96_008789 [Phlyctochytrium bullatum]
MQRRPPSSDSDSDSDSDDQASTSAAANAPKPAAPVLPRVPPWSRHMRVERSMTTDGLTGDRLKMSPAVLEEILRLAGPMALPNPLVFEIVAQGSSTPIYGSVREFTAQSDNLVLVSPDLAAKLVIPEDEGDGAVSMEVDGEMEVFEASRPFVEATVRLAALPKVEYLKLAPLEETYLQIADIRATLESHLRKNYATVSENDTLTIAYRPSFSAPPQENHFLITEVRPARSCTCIDVDVNLDIVPLDMGLAESAVKLKYHMTGQGAAGATLVQLAKKLEDGRLWLEEKGSVEKDSTVVYKLRNAEKTRILKVSVEPETGDADLFVSTTVEVPSLTDHRYMNVQSGTSKLHFKVEEDSADAPFIFFGVHGYAPQTTFRFRIETSKEAPPPNPSNLDTQPASGSSDDVNESERPSPDSRRCSNCTAWIPAKSLPMHEAFCLRNNAICQHCKDAGRPFVIRKPEFPDHWHCDECAKVGNLAEKEKHITLLHTPFPCSCGAHLPAPLLAPHRLTLCPDRLLICPFCRLLVRAGAPTTTPLDPHHPATSRMLSEHESDCGARTIPCIKCHKNVRLRDVQRHHRLHDEERKRQPLPKLCPNSQCAGVPTDNYPNLLGLCRGCFGPFWSPNHDPNNQRLATKLLGAYHAQMSKGCGKAHCQNKYCATSSNPSLLTAPMDPTEAAVHALGLLKKSALFRAKSASEYDLCVSDAASAARRHRADVLAGLGYHVAWCVKALTECKDDAGKAENWLRSNAPRLDGT